MKEKLQKSMEQMNSAMGQVAEKSKQVAAGTKENMQNLALKIHDENTKALLKKYNPLFPEEYSQDGLPNMIIIVDDAVRKDIEVCKGAIGWKSNQRGVEVFHLYDEAVEFSGLKFVPMASCDSVYYVDCFDRNKYIKLDGYFDSMQNSKVAELEHIAFSLGVKKYSIELQESSIEECSANKKAFENVKLPFGASKKAVSSSAEASVESQNISHKKMLQSAEFANGAEPVQPNLKWFKHDDKINNLIEMCLSGQIMDNSMKNYTFELEGSVYSSMGASTAAKIDAAVSKLGTGAGYDMTSKEKKESNRKLVFKVEF